MKKTLCLILFTATLAYGQTLRPSPIAAGGGGGGGGVCPAGSANTVQKTDGTDCAASSVTDDGTNVLTTENVISRHVSADVFGGSFTLQKRGTTGNSSAAVSSGSELGYFQFQGWDGSAYCSTCANILGAADEAWTGSAHGSRYQFGTIPNGTTSIRWAMRLDNSGNLRYFPTAVVGWPASGGDANNALVVGLTRHTDTSIEVNNGTAGSLSALYASTYNGALYQTATNCADAAGAAACGSAAAGAVVIDAGSTSVVVSTTAVTASSRIMVMFDSSLGTELSVTCNATVALPAVTARTAATSFTITVPAAPVTNPACFTYWVVN